MRPDASAATAEATSCGVPQRCIGTMPPAMRSSYCAATDSVIGVRMMPGRTSNTPMPSAARRSAKSRVSMPRPAFDMQYSPRSMDASSALTDDTVTMARACSLPLDAMCRATA